MGSLIEDTYSEATSSGNFNSSLQKKPEKLDVVVVVLYFNEAGSNPTKSKSNLKEISYAVCHLC